MDARIEATALTARADVVGAAVRVVVVQAPPAFPTQRAVASFPRTLSLGGTSLSAVAPDLVMNGGLYALV